MLARRLGLLLALSLSACGRAGEPPAATRTETAVSDVKWIETFPAYPGARRLCGQHVTGNGMHIEWSAYATTTATEQVIAFYAGLGLKNGITGTERDGASFTLRGPNDRVLSIHPAGGAYPRCDVAPAAGDATVIIVSQAIR